MQSCLVLSTQNCFTADKEEIDALFSTNVLGVVRVNRAILPHLRERGAGLLLYTGNTTSLVLPLSTSEESLAAIAYECS